MAAHGRRAIVALYQAAVPADLGWTPGPLPLASSRSRADAAARSTYYPPRTVRLLYGEPERACRWHKELKVRAGTATVTALEAIRVDDRSGMLLVHLIPGDVLGALRELAGRHADALNGLDVRQLAPELAITGARPYTLAFVTSARRYPRLYSLRRYPRWPAVGQWLWALASRTSADDFPPDPAAISEHKDDRTRLSADWSCMVLRDGMALVGTRADRGDSDPFYGQALLYARTIYTDAIALSLLQLQGITALEEELAGIPDALGDSAMEDLERQLTAFRHRLWWQHLTAHGPPNQILAAFHRQHRLSERFEQILAEVSDYSRMAHEDQARDVNNSTVLITVITVPAGIGLAVLQVFGHPSSGEFILVIALCLVISLLVLLTRPGRLAIRSIRRRFFLAK